MTNSTNTPKKKAASGPIRTGLVLPLALLIAGVFVYTKFFFDHNVKWAIEFAGTKIHGAQVDVASFNSSFLGASFDLNDLEITDKEKPTHNIFEIKKIAANISWDALLRGKMLIENFALDGITWQSTRRSPGKVLPPEPVVKSSEPSAGAKLAGEAKSAALQAAQKKYDGNALGNLAAILEGGDAKQEIGEIRDELSSEKYLTALESELSSKQQSIEAKIQSLPKKEELEALELKIKNTTLDKNPLEAAKQLKGFKEDIEKISGAIKTVKATQSEVAQTVKSLDEAYKKIDDLIEEDLKALQARFNLPSFDTKNLAQQLFGPMVVAKLGSSKKYIDIARQYLPPKKTAEEKAKDELAKPKPRPRASGVDFRFPKKGGYPLVWIKKIAISSHAPDKADGGTQGNLSGKGSDFSTDSQLVGRPMLLEIAGDFPGQQIYGAKFNLTLNHHNDDHSEEIKVVVGDYPVAEYQLSKSEKLAFGLSKAHGQVSFALKHNDEQLSMDLNNRFQKIDYLVQAQNKKAEAILRSIIRDINSISLDAHAQGTWTTLDWQFSSNLGDQLASGLKREVEERVKGAKDKLRQKIDEKIGGKKKSLEAKFASVKSKLNSVFADKENEINVAKDKAQASLGDKAKSQSAGASDMLKKGLKKFKL